MVTVSNKQKIIDFANVFKAFIGSGYLSIPFAFGKSGIVLGVIMLLLIGFLNGFCCVQIVKCKDFIISKLLDQFESKYRSGAIMKPEAELVRLGQLRTKFEDRITLGHIAKYVFGKTGQWTVTICLFISQFGFCTGYYVFIGNTLVELIYTYTTSNMTGNYSGFRNESVVPHIKKDIFLIYMILVPLPIFILFSLLRTIRNMGLISVIANLAIAFGYFSVLSLLIIGFGMSSDYKLLNFASVAVMFGILTSAFEGIGTVIPIESSMIGNRHNFSPYIYTTISLVIGIFGSFGIIGQLRYGTGTQQIILQNLTNSSFLMAVNSILVVSVLCTYPLQMYPVVEIVEFLFFRKRSTQFAEDRINILSNDECNEFASEIEKINDELICELSIHENDQERERDEAPQFNSIVSANHFEDATNYGSMQNTHDINSGKTLKSIIESIYTKKQIRMIRAIHGGTIQAPAWKQNIIRMTLVLLQLGLALLMRNNFAYLSAFIGAIGSSFLCYILPAATHFKLSRSTNEKLYSRIADILIVIFGIVGSIASLIITIYDMCQ